MRTSVRSCVAFGLALALPVAASAGWRSEGPFLGNIKSLAIASSQPDTVYAAASGGGVWRSTDGGATWSLPGDDMTSRDIRWIQVDPLDPRGVWAGLRSTGSGSALWRSTDGGANWWLVADSYKGGRVSATGAPIAFSPTQPKTILVASTNLHYRTDDGGRTWSDFRVPNQDAYVFAFHPTDPKVVFAGGRGDNQNISRSNDGGRTWRQVGIGLGKNSIHTLLVDPRAPTTLYASGGTFTNVFKSTDNGDSWATLPVPAGSTSDLYSLTLDPKDGRILWAATEDGLFKSDDGGASWAKSERGTGRYYVQCVAIDPRDSRRLLAGAGGDGVYSSRDGGANWQSSNAGLAAGWVEKLWGDPRSATLFAQLATGLFRHDASGWSELGDPFASGDKADVDGFLFDAASAQTVYAFDTSKYWRSADGGKRWQEIEQKGPSMRDMMKGNIESAQFSSLVQESGNPKVFYAGAWSNDGPGGAIYKTVDAGKKWAPSGNGVPNEKVGLLRAAGPGTVFAVVDGTSVYRTTNGGAAWTEAGSGLPGSKILDLVVDPTNPSRIFAASEKGLFRSRDSGGSWQRVGAGAGGIEDDEIGAIVVDPASGSVYAGTFHGLFRSTDGGESWDPFAQGLANEDVRALALSGSPARLWVGLAGGSSASIELP